ncbi:MAG: DUF11 domain-containing protein, partial [Desulfuromonadales bacterium]|nr:DUF11 domain-containing protein [Desulfuromonadales bacterium]
LLLFFALVLGATTSVQAAGVMCSQFTLTGVNPLTGVNAYEVDGYNPVHRSLIESASTFGIDANCTIKNFPESAGGFPITTINYQFWGNSTFYIVFDNIYYPGNMSCNNPSQATFWIYWAPGGYNKISAACQQFMVPVDAVIKQNPPAQTTARIGIPFVYTIKAPVMGKLDASGVFQYLTNADTHNLENVVIADDLSKTGAALSYLSNAAYLVNPNTGTRTQLNEGSPLVLGASSAWLSDHPDVSSDSTKHLVFSYENNPTVLGLIPAGYNLEIDLTVVLDSDTSVNKTGVQFSNIAEMWFNKTINSTYMSDLHAWLGTTLPMSVIEPNLVVDKTSTVTNLNLGVEAPYKIDVANLGGGTAYNATITDNLPAGMCQYPPSTVTAQIFAADGTTPVSSLLTRNTDYSLNWSGPTASACQLTLTMLNTAAAKIAPTQRLIINYKAQLDVGTASGLSFPNVAGATSWFNAESSNTTRFEYVKPLNNGTPGTLDSQDVYTVTSAVAGYYFLKSVEDLTTGTSSATAAFPGDKLRYTLQLQNFTLPALGNITITDDLGLNAVGAIWPGSLVLVSENLPITAMLDVDPIGGTNGAGAITISGLNLGTNQQYQIQFDVTLNSSLTSGINVSNQAFISGTVLDEFGNPTSISYTNAPSDDPYTIGPKLLSNIDVGDVTKVTIQAPGPLAKENPAGKTTVMIGEQFKYTISVPAVPVDVALYDVQIKDTLPENLGLVSATAHLVSGTQSWTLTKVDDGADIILKEMITGLDIPAKDQVIVEITVELKNIDFNTDGKVFSNRASYLYNKVNGVNTTEGIGGEDTTDILTVVEPELTVTKAVSFVTPAGKTPADPAMVGDVLKYTVTIDNSGGDSFAYDTNIVDTLPSSVVLVPNSATAQINGTGVTGFVVEPTSLTGGALVWGRENGDGNLDIPAGESLVLTYQVTVVDTSAGPITNSVYVDWTSLDEVHTGERTGEGCGTTGTTSPNLYCVGTVSAIPVYTADNTFITKSVYADSYTDDTSTTPHIVRVGDTVTYDLTLNLQEYTTRNVVVVDALPAGMVYDTQVSITPTSGISSSTTSVLPVFDATDGTLRWEFDNIINTPSNDNTPIDTLVIRYVAKVVTDAPTVGVDFNSSNLLVNTAKLSYLGGNSDSLDPLVHARLNTLATTIEVRQPVMSDLTKLDYGTGRIGTGSSTDPYQVDIVNDTMKFRLQTCNTAGLAPAYNLLITDQLPVELAAAPLVGWPVVKIGAGTNPATAVPVPSTDYSYTLSGGQMSFAFIDARPINPGECVFVEYDIGFDNDIAPDTTWNNSAQVQKYYSLPAKSGREYVPTVPPATVYMTNVLALNVPTKTIALPVAPTTTVTIGEEVQYTITVPGTPVNAILTDVAVNDILDPALVYLNAAVAGTFVLTDTTAPGSQNVNLTIDSIPAGQQAVITLRARVANDATTDAGDVFTNKASYTYNGTTLESLPTAPLTIVEPAVTVVKSVSPPTPPTAGDILTYSVQLTASDSANAYDLELGDELGAGLEYVDGSTGIVGSPGTLSTSGSTLTGTGIVIPKGSTVTVTYQVLVQNSVVASQTLTNSVIARWTSLSGQSDFERTGADGVGGLNDYVATGTFSLTTPADATTLTKSRLRDTYSADANVRVGDLVEFELRLGLQEGSHFGLLLNDTLPAGMAFAGMLSANYFGTAVTAPEPVQSGQTLTWNLGDVVNATADNDPNNDYQVIVYRARVLNSLAQADSTPRTNTATLDYTLGGTSAPQLTARETITVLQPMLTVNKLAAPAGGATVIAANEVITYTVEIQNSGAAPAYDTVLVDTLPVGLRQGGVTTTSITLVGTSTSRPNLAPVYDPATGVATWDFDSGGADTYTIPAGETLRVVYTVTADPNLGPGLTLTNTAQVTRYYSFDDEAVPVNGSVGDRKLYGPTNEAEQTLTTPLPGALLKENPANATATIGQEFTYTITVPAIPQPTALHDVRIYDDLAAINADLTLMGIEKVTGSSTINTGTWTLVNTGTPTSLIIEDTITGIEIPANEQIVIGVTVRLNNVAKNSAGLTFSNTASYTYNQIDGDTSTVMQGGSSTTPAMTVVEPSVTVVKSVSPATPPTAGDILTYSVELMASDSANAYDLELVDELGAGLEYVDGSTGIVGSPGTLSTSGSTLTGTGIVIPKGSTVTVTYQVLVQNSVVASQTLTNSVIARWTSLSGQSDFERTGADGVGGLNDYVATGTFSLTTPADATTLTKSRLRDTYSADANVRVGDLVEFELRLGLQEGSHFGLLLNDTLPAGMAFAGMLSANYFGTAVTAPEPVQSGQTLTWNLGDVVNATADNDPNNDYQVIVYRARVLNSLAQADSTPRTNTATLDYTLGGTSAPQLTARETITVLQPMLTVNKLAAPAGGATVIAANEVITYTVEIQNSGAAPAYDTVLVDTLPVGLRQGGVTTTSITLVGTSTSRPNLAPVYDPATGVATWDFDSGGADTYTIPAGETLRVVYTVTADPNLGPGLTLTNTAQVTRYYSFDDEAVPVNGSVGDRKLYGPTNEAEQTLTTPLPGALLKENPANATATIGQEFTYTITVPAIPQPTALHDVRIYDDLAAINADLTLMGIEKVTGSSTINTGTWTLVNTGTPTSLIIEDTITGIEIPANEQIVIGVTVRLNNVAKNSAGLTFSNTASYTYNQIDGNPSTVMDGGSSTTPLMTVVEPSVTVAKSVSPMTPPTAGDILTYSVQLTGTYTSSAYDLVLVGDLGSGLEYVANSTIIVGSSGTQSTSGSTLTWAGIDIPKGGTVTVTYQVLVQNSVVANQTLTNSVTARWTSLAGLSDYERTGADGIDGLNNYFAEAAAPPLTVPIPTLTLQKIVTKLSGTTEVTAATANPGDRLRYTLTIQNPTAIQLVNFSLLDLLERLHATPMFQPGTIVLDPALPLPTGATAVIGADTLSITGLNIAPNETLTIAFETLLRTDLKSGTVVLNQAELQGPWPAPIKSDDPNVPGAENPTQTVIPANGVVYDAEERKPLAGMTLTMQLAATGIALPVSCFVDPSQQNQVTPANGEYKFDLKFNATDCPEGADYLIAVTAVTGEYEAEPSLILLPATPDPYSVPVCSADALPATPQCEAHISTTTPTGADTTYYLRLTLDANSNQLFNNHIPVDPKIEEKIYITKKSPLLNVTRGQLVPYTITFKNTLRSVLPALGIVDLLPPGFKYVAGSSRYDAAPLEPVINGRQLRWDNLDIGYKQEHTIKLLLVVGAGVTEGEYVNQAYVLNITSGDPFSEIATSTVRVIPDPDFDCTDVIGKVFDDRDLNGEQDPDEDGLAGVRVVSARGLIATTDEDGRFHITCAVVPEETRGSNFILKLDDRSLPTGYRVTSENPLVQRATRGKMLRYNFGATIHRVVGIDIAEGVFEPNSTVLRLQWAPKIPQLMAELRKAPAVLRLSYLADIEREGLVQDRLEALKNEVIKHWALTNGGYRLNIETEVFWRRGGPP